MAMGKAVVTTATSGQGALQLVQEGQTGYFIPTGDVAGWRRAITHMLDHPEEARRMGQQARSIVEQGLNLDSYLAATAGIVSSLAPAGSEGASSGVLAKG